MSILDKLFGGKNPADAARPYLDQIPGIGHQGYDPYINQGRDASGRTKSRYEEMFSDPTAFMNKLMEGYKPSEGYQFQKEQLTNELGNTAAAGGVAGTPMDQMNQGQGVQKLLSGDMQQYLQNALGINQQGLAGEEGIAGRGFDATKSLTDLLGGAMNQQGGLAFQGQSQQNSNKTALWSSLAKALGMMGAGALGGPLGGLMAGGMGSSMFGGG